jgi:hypothetical protein
MIFFMLHTYNSTLDNESALRMIGDNWAMDHGEGGRRQQGDRAADDKTRGGGRFVGSGQWHDVNGGGDHTHRRSSGRAHNNQKMMVAEMVGRRQCDGLRLSRIYK